jgi:hypothetical protein
MKSSRSKKATHFLAICGVTAPVVMLVLWTIASLLRPGYDQVTQYGSELGTGPNAIIMNSNFFITGWLVVAFAAGLLRGVHVGRWFQFGSVLVGTFGIGELLTALIPCDPGCPIAAQSLSQLAHNVDAVIAFTALALAPILVSKGFGYDDYWKPYRTYSLITGIVAMALLSVFSASVLGYFGFVGLLQRLFLAGPFLWIEVMATRLLEYG